MVVELAQVGGLEGLDEHRGVGVVEPVPLAARATSGSSSEQADGRRSRSGAWSRGRCRSAPVPPAPSCCARSSTSSNVGTSNRPSSACWPGGRAAGAPAARSVFSSARVKSSVNQPVTAAPSIDLGGPAVGELGVVGDVGRAADLVLVAGDEHAVLGRDEVGLDEVGAHARWRAGRRPGCARAGSRGAPRWPMTSGGRQLGDPRRGGGPGPRPRRREGRWGRRPAGWPPYGRSSVRSWDERSEPR